MKFLFIPVLLGILTVQAATDGPYVMITGDGAMSAWYADQAKGSFSKRTEPVEAGNRLRIHSADNRPAFEVTLRTPTSTSDSAETDWPKSAPVFFMADSHGEFEICTELLIQHKVIDGNLRWSFGRGHLVVLGDIFDRGAHQTEILWLLYKLEAEAVAAGGQLHVLLGNHEVMTLTGDIRYLNHKYNLVAEAMFVGGYSELLSPDTLLGRWIRTKPVLLKIGDVLAAHGGISIDTVLGDYRLEEINTLVATWLNDGQSKTSGRLSFVTGRNGPLWYRNLVKEHAKPEDVRAALEYFGVNRFAVGHTKVPTVTAQYQGAVIAVQVYPTRDQLTGQMNMEGVYIDEQGVWHKAKIDGTREILKNDKGEVIRNGGSASANALRRDKQTAEDRERKVDDAKATEAKKAA